MLVKEIAQPIQLEKGRFCPAEASEILDAMTKERINFHRIQMLRTWEGNHRCDTSHWNKKIEAIQAEKGSAQELIEEAKREGLHLEINCKVEIRLVKPLAHAMQFDISEN